MRPNQFMAYLETFKKKGISGGLLMKHGFVYEVNLFMKHPVYHRKFKTVDEAVEYLDTNHS